MRCARNPDHEITSLKDAWWEVTGWARPKHLTGRSGSSLIGRTKNGRAICPRCASDIEHGTDPNQGEMFK